jgi:hypothetical protein
VHFQTFCTRRNRFDRSGSRCCTCVRRERDRCARLELSISRLAVRMSTIGCFIHQLLLIPERGNSSASCRRDIWRPACTLNKERNVRVNQENGIRPRNIGSRKRLLLAFTRSTQILDPWRPSAVYEGLPFLTQVLRVVMSIAITHGLGYAQVAVASQGTIVSSTTTAHDGSDGSPSTAIHQASPCRFQVQDQFPQPSEAEAMIGTLDYTPLSARCKFNLFLQQTHSPYTFVSAGFQATWAQAMGQWPHYGGGMQGWAKRFGATLADTESRRFIQTYALSTILHQDPRYFPSGKRTLIARVWYSTTRIVVTKSDNGNSVFNTSEFLGALLSSALQNAYYPRDDQNFGDTMNRFGGALSSDAITDLLHEFAPDMKRLFRKHAPKKILKIEEKLPIPAGDRP